MARGALVRAALLAALAGVIVCVSLLLLRTPEPGPSARDLYLARMREHSPFRRTIEEPVAPEWLAADRVASGDFQQAELQGVGKVSVLQLGAERRVFLERYDVDFAPGLHVELLRSVLPADAGKGLDLGELRYAAGRQSFTVPADARLEEFQAVGVFDPKLALQIVRAKLTFAR